MDMDLRDLSDSQVSSIRYCNHRPVVDCDGNAIGTAKCKHGAALITVRMCNLVGFVTTVAEVEPTIKELDDRFVVE